MEADHITIVGPDISEFFNEVIFLGSAVHDLK